MEIEARVKIKNLGEIKNRLISMGADFKKEAVQNDLIFKRKEDLGRVQGAGAIMLRLRDTAEKKILTFKALTDQAGAWEEHEVLIDDIEEMKRILIKIGFVEVLHMNKKRIKGMVDDFEVCLDNIKQMGTWMEVCIESENKEKAKKRLVNFLNNLGIKENEIEHRGYIAMLLEERGFKFDNTG